MQQSLINRWTRTQYKGSSQGNETTKDHDTYMYFMHIRTVNRPSSPSWALSCPIHFVFVRLCCVNVMYWVLGFYSSMSNLRFTYVCLQEIYPTCGGSCHCSVGDEGERELVVSLEQCIGHVGKCLGRDVQRLGCRLTIAIHLLCLAPL